MSKTLELLCEDDAEESEGKNAYIKINIPEQTQR